jgi:arylsulfatase A-like enzyme
MRALVAGDEKLVWSAYGDTVELYDRGADPGELHNLAGDRPQRVRELAAAMREAVRFRLPPGELALSDEARAQMRALGYAD